MLSAVSVNVENHCFRQNNIFDQVNINDIQIIIIRKMLENTQQLFSPNFA